MFQYADNLPAHINPSPVNMSVNQTVYNFNLDKNTYQGLPGMIADSLPDKWTKQHQMSINGKFKIKDIDKNDLIAVAKKFSISNPIKIINKIKKALLNWNDLAQQYNLNNKQRVAIGREIQLNLINFNATKQ